MPQLQREFLLQIVEWPRKCCFPLFLGRGANAMDWGCLTPATTLVLYMPGPDYAEVSRRLGEAGLPGDLPCVIVSGASGAQQQVRWSSVGALSNEEKLPAPALMIVGRVASQQVREISDAFWRGERNESSAQSIFRKLK